jgi:hypothetical protein
MIVIEEIHDFHNGPLPDSLYLGFPPSIVFSMREKIKSLVIANLYKVAP